MASLEGVLVAADIDLRLDEIAQHPFRAKFHHPPITGPVAGVRTRHRGNSGNVIARMTSCARAGTIRARCGAVAAVGTGELLGLAQMSEYVYPDGDRLGCELVARHGGHHVALVATSDGGDRWWWLRWDLQHDEVVQIDPCAAELQQGRYTDDCFLPEDHPGAHSFALPPPPPLLGRRHPVRLRPRTP